MNFQASANFPKVFLGGFERFQWFARGERRRCDRFEALPGVIDFSLFNQLSENTAKILKKQKIDQPRRLENAPG